MTQLQIFRLILGQNLDEANGSSCLMLATALDRNENTLDILPNLPSATGVSSNSMLLFWVLFRRQYWIEWCRTKHAEII